MNQISQRLVLKVLTITLLFSSFGFATAKADIDPAVCGLGGAIGGGSIGHQFGGGDGKTAMTIIGAIVGATAANRYCKQAENPDDIRMARQNEREMLMRGSEDQHEWSNPRFGQRPNAHSHIERRGRYRDRECTMTRSIMQSSDGGRFVNETYWCNDRGNWSQVTETTTIGQIRWGVDGPVQSTTTETTATYRGGRTPMPPPRVQVLPNWIVNENRMARYLSDFEREWGHPDRAAREVAFDLSRSQQFISLDQLGRILAQLHFDRERAQVLNILALYADPQFGSIESVTQVYDFDSNREEARRHLDQVIREKRMGSRRDRRGDHRHEERRDAARGEWYQRR